MSARIFQLSEEDLECSICFECWVDKQPGHLSCQHVFCMQCLSKFEIISGEISCSICREKTKIPENGIEALPKPLFKELLQPQKKKIEMCEIHKKEIFISCKSHYKTNLCFDCWKEEHKSCSLKIKDNFNYEIKGLIESFMENEKKVKESIQKKINELQEKQITTIWKKEKLNVFEKIIGEFFEKRIENMLKEIDNNSSNLKKSITYLIENMENLEEIFMKRLKMFSEKHSNLEESYDNSNEARNPLSLKSFLSFPDKLINEQELKSKVNKPFLCFQIASSDDSGKPFFYFEIDGANKLEKAIFSIGESKDISHLLINNLGMKTKEFDKLIEELMQSSNFLEKLEFKNCNLKKENYEKISGILKNCKKIKCLCFVNEKQLTEGFHYLNQSIKSSNISKTLKEITLNYCELMSNDVNNLKSFLSNCSNLEKVDLSGNVGLRSNFCEISKSLLNSTNSLKSLLFSTCEIEFNGLVEIGKLLLNCNQIEKIDLSYNSLGMENFHLICHSLKNSKDSIKEMNFSNCDLSRNCIKIFSLELLKKCKSLEKLSLNENCCAVKEEISLLCKILRKNCQMTLRQVNLQNCGLNQSEEAMVKEKLNFCSQISFEMQL